MEAMRIKDVDFDWHVKPGGFVNQPVCLSEFNRYRQGVRHLFQKAGSPRQLLGALFELLKFRFVVDVGPGRQLWTCSLILAQFVSLQRNSNYG